jgi:hypothetical protein
MESDENNAHTDGAEGTEEERSPSAQAEKPRLLKRQRSKGGGKKKERTFDWPKKSLYEATFVDSVSGEEVELWVFFVIHIISVLCGQTISPQVHCRHFFSQRCVHCLNLLRCN